MKLANKPRKRHQYVLITGCSDPDIWYRNKRLFIYNYIGEENDFYWTLDSEGKKNIVWKEDGEIKEIAPSKQNI